jgi:hypothetical protein
MPGMIIQAIFKFAAPEKWASHFTGQADTRKMLFRYSRLCGTASDVVDAVILLRRIKIGNAQLR